MSPILITERQADYQDTEKSTAQTVAQMCEYIRDAMSDPELQRIAASLIDPDYPNASRQWKAGAVWQWLKNNIKFVPDDVMLRKLLGKADELEALISPSVMVRPELLEQARGYRQMEGDCDCFVMTGLVLLALLGVPPLIETLKCDRREPWRWSHVCGGAILEDGSCFPLDASHGDYPGWHVPLEDVFASQYWDMNGNKVGGHMRGVMGYTPAPNWTGNELTTVRGRHAGPYPSRDFTRMYVPGTSQRLAGLQGISRGRLGMGTGGDPSSADTLGGLLDSIGSNPLPSGGGTFYDPLSGDTVDSTTGAIISGPILGGSPASSSSGSFNVGNFFNTLLGDAASLAGRALQPGAQVLPNGSILLPSGQVVAGSPAGTIGGISTTTLLIGGGILFAVLLLVGKK